MSENHEALETNEMESVKDTDNGNDVQKIHCETVGDLLPLYVDEVLSPSSVALVEQHLAECESCTEKVNSLQKETTVKDYDGAKPMKKFKNRLRRHKIITGVTIGVCVAVLLGIFLYSFEYAYHYDQLKNDIEVISDSDGHIHVVYHGDKLLFSKYRLTLTGIRDGKAQYRLELYESINFYDWWKYHFDSNLISKEYHDKGIPFELFTVCPDDQDFGWWCRVCGDDDRFVENHSLWSEGGLSRTVIYNYDNPNPYTEEEWDTLDFVNPDTDPYEPYEKMGVEISEIYYSRFHNTPWFGRYDKKNLIWKRGDFSYIQSIEHEEF